MLYPTHDLYVSAVNKAANDLLLQGFILKEEAQLTMDNAAKSTIGK